MERKVLQYSEEFKQEAVHYELFPGNKVVDSRLIIFPGDCERITKLAE